MLFLLVTEANGAYFLLRAYFLEIGQTRTATQIVLHNPRIDPFSSLSIAYVKCKSDVICSAAPMSTFLQVISSMDIYRTFYERNKCDAADLVID